VDDVEEALEVDGLEIRDEDDAVRALRLAGEQSACRLGLFLEAAGRNDEALAVDLRGNE
jgi:hypothetical protein